MTFPELSLEATRKLSNVFKLWRKIISKLKFYVQPNYPLEVRVKIFSSMQVLRNFLTPWTLSLLEGTSTEKRQR